MRYFILISGLILSTGLAQAQSFEGKLVGKDGMAMPGYPIIVTEMGNSNAFGKVFFTDPSGKFTITDLPPGDYGVLTRHTDTPKATLHIEGDSKKSLAVKQRSVAKFFNDGKGATVQDFVMQNRQDIPRYTAKFRPTQTAPIDIGKFEFSWK